MTTANGTNYYEGQISKHGGGDLFFMLTKIVSKYPPQEREKKFSAFSKWGLGTRGFGGPHLMKQRSLELILLSKLDLKFSDLVKYYNKEL